MTVEEQLKETSTLLTQAIELLEKGLSVECRNLLVTARTEIEDSLEKMKLRAAHE